jgi:hypothetical protein
MLVLGIAVFTVGSFAGEPHADLLFVAGFATFFYVVGQWRGNATSQLVQSLAERLREEEYDANAAPNGGPATRIGNSAVGEGPPSVS